VVDVRAVEPAELGDDVDTETRVRIGAAGWTKPLWRGQFYPKGLPQRAELEYASEHLGSIEINGTFHARQRSTSFIKWRDATPEGFVFSVKGLKTVSHEHRLQTPAKDLTSFFTTGVLGLGDALGPIFWQLPPYVRFGADDARARVEGFLAALPHTSAEVRELVESEGVDIAEYMALDGPDRPLRHAVEVRHESFDTPEFVELLRRHGVAPVVTNAPGLPVVDAVTADVIYVRLQIDAEHYADGYDDAALDDWAARLHGWATGSGCPDGVGRDVFAYFYNPDDSGFHAPLDAVKLAERVAALG
jgi:uncharacterized protein YecE (DUF72 family)